MRYFIILILAFSLSGCAGIIPRITTDTPNTVPQVTQKSKAKEICKGKAEWDEMGNILSCSKGYFRYDYGYNKQERRMTIIERVRSWINAVLAWGIPGLIVLFIFFPGIFMAVGTLIGKLIERAYGSATVALKRVVKAVQKTRKEGKDLNQALEAELDAKDKDYITKVKKKEKIK